MNYNTQTTSYPFGADSKQIWVQSYPTNHLTHTPKAVNNDNLSTVKHLLIDSKNPTKSHSLKYEKLFTTDSNTTYLETRNFTRSLEITTFTAHNHTKGGKLNEIDEVPRPGLVLLLVALSLLLFIMILSLFLPKHMQDALFRFLLRQSTEFNFNYIDVGLYKTRHSMYRKEVFSVVMRRKALAKQRANRVRRLRQALTKTGARATVPKRNIGTVRGDANEIGDIELSTTCSQRDDEGTIERNEKREDSGRVIGSLNGRIVLPKYCTYSKRGHIRFRVHPRVADCGQYGQMEDHAKNTYGKVVKTDRDFTKNSPSLNKSQFSEYSQDQIMTPRQYELLPFKAFQPIKCPSTNVTPIRLHPIQYNNSSTNLIYPSLFQTDRIFFTPRRCSCSSIQNSIETTEISNCSTSKCQGLVGENMNNNLLSWACVLAPLPERKKNSMPQHQPIGINDNNEDNDGSLEIRGKAKILGYSLDNQDIHTTAARYTNATFNMINSQIEQNSNSVSRLTAMNPRLIVTAQQPELSLGKMDTLHQCAEGNSNRIRNTSLNLHYQNQNNFNPKFSDRSPVIIFDDRVVNNLSTNNTNSNRVSNHLERANTPRNCPATSSGSIAQDFILQGILNPPISSGKFCESYKTKGVNVHIKKYNCSCQVDSKDLDNSAELQCTEPNIATIGYFKNILYSTDAPIMHYKCHKGKLFESTCKSQMKSRNRENDDDKNNNNTKRENGSNENLTNRGNTPLVVVNNLQTPHKHISSKNEPQTSKTISRQLIRNRNAAQYATCKNKLLIQCNEEICRNVSNNGNCDVSGTIHNTCELKPPNSKNKYQLEAICNNSNSPNNLHLCSNMHCEACLALDKAINTRQQILNLADDRRKNAETQLRSPSVKVKCKNCRSDYALRRQTSEEERCTDYVDVTCCNNVEMDTNKRMINISTRKRPSVSPGALHLRIAQFQLHVQQHLKSSTLATRFASIANSPRQTGFDSTSKELKIANNSKQKGGEHNSTDKLALLSRKVIPKGIANKTENYPIRTVNKMFTQNNKIVIPNSHKDSGHTNSRGNVRPQNPRKPLPHLCSEEQAKKQLNCYNYNLSFSSTFDDIHINSPPPNQAQLTQCKIKNGCDNSLGEQLPESNARPISDQVDKEGITALRLVNYSCNSGDSTTSTYFSKQYDYRRHLMYAKDCQLLTSALKTSDRLRRNSIKMKNIPVKNSCIHDTATQTMDLLQSGRLYSWTENERNEGKNRSPNYNDMEALILPNGKSESPASPDINILHTSRLHEGVAPISHYIALRDTSNIHPISSDNAECKAPSDIRDNQIKNNDNICPEHEAITNPHTLTVLTKSSDSLDRQFCDEKCLQRKLQNRNSDNIAVLPERKSTTNANTFKIASVTPPYSDETSSSVISLHFTAPNSANSIINSASFILSASVSTSPSCFTVSSPNLNNGSPEKCCQSYKNIKNVSGPYSSNNEFYNTHGNQQHRRFWQNQHKKDSTTSNKKRKFSLINGKTEAERPKPVINIFYYSSEILRSGSQSGEIRDNDSNRLSYEKSARLKPGMLPITRTLSLATLSDWL